MRRFDPRTTSPTGPLCGHLAAAWCAACLAAALATPATAGQWVVSPHPETLSGYYEAGGDVAAHVTASGDRLLFFDTWSASWTAHDLDPPLQPVRLLAGGEVALLVSEGRAVAFDGPDRAVHELVLVGDLLDTEYSWPSYAAGEQLAVVVTDQAMHVYDATRDAWQSFANPITYLPGHFETRAAPDLAFCEVRRSDGVAVNVAYSLRTGTFDRAEPGIPGVRNQLLDHGFAGATQVASPAVGALGYSAVTGCFTHQDIQGAALGVHTVDRKRRALSHLWGYVWQEVHEQQATYHQYAYDTLTGTWSHHQRSYEYGEYAPRSYPEIGGRLLSTTLGRSGAPAHHELAFFHGPDHTLRWHDADLRGSNVWPATGGAVIGWGEQRSDQDPRWLCVSTRHPEGLLFSTQHPELGGRRAGEDWIMFCAHDPDQPLMDVHVYHGDRNTVITTQTWANAYADPPDLDGLSAYLFRCWGDDEDVIFYSAIRHELAHHHYPEDTWVAQYLSRHLALTYTSSAGNALYDPFTGVIHSRPCAYGNDNLGDHCAIAEDEATATLHAYSVLTGAWSTRQAGGDCHDTAGDRIAVGHRTDHSACWAFNAEDGSWTQLTPASNQSGAPRVGGRTAVVADQDRLWAYAPGTWTAVPDLPPGDTAGDDLADGPAGDDPADGSGDRATAADGTAADGPPGDPARPRTPWEALAVMRCGPSPFNARLTASLTLPRPAHVRADVFDLRGRQVAALQRGPCPAGPLRLTWDTADAPSGTYLLRVAADQAVAIRKVMLVR